MGIEISDLEEELNKYARVVNELNERSNSLQQELENTRNSIVANSGAYQQTRFLILKLDPNYFEKKEQPREDVVEEETKKKGKKTKMSLLEEKEETL